ncbi:acyltransferase domain-containing protein [Methyloversatilis discipulorum]|uniref:acyltransferase domain-containing protein n=1 Tax=Methyloversatilis discipulorum TaxID=1119528 RepID=UPI001A5DFD90|nr:acyltransferase domain-containing protein [Methyloversatilis discipulorum]MBL8468607.1 acyltransferase domain-containing protein [Methyloversatilis discipulorum]
MRLAVLFSGQGGQSSEHLSELRADADTRARLPALDALRDDDLASNVTAQVVISALQALRWRRLAPRLPQPVLFAGYSLGELSAFAIARRLPPKDWFDLAARRAALMDAATACPSGLLAVQGMPEAALRAALDGSGCSIAIRNGDAHFVVGGASIALSELEHTLPTHGARRCVRLAVRTPSHTPLLAAARAPLAEALTPWADGRLSVPVIAGIDGRVRRDAADAVRALAAQVAQTIDWSTCMDTLLEYAPDAVLEIGPGNALARMLAERAPDLPVRAIDDFSGDAAVVDWLERMAG